jgi:hypothetical protein
LVFPETLRACAVYDTSARFDPTLQELIRYLRGESPAPKAPNAIGNNDRKYVTDRNFLMLVDSNQE